MPYGINPCKAAFYKAQKENCGPNEISRTCYETAAAFTGNSDVWNIPEDLANLCNNCVYSKFGRPACGNHTPYRPVVFEQVPHFFPNLMEKCQNVENARVECKQMCGNTEYPLECAELCDVDAAAVVMEKSKENYETSVNNSPKNGDDNKPKDPSYDDYARDNPAAFYTALIIVLVIFSIIIGIFLYILFQK